MLTTIRTVLILIMPPLLAASCQKRHTLFQSLDPAATGIHFSNRITENDTFNILTYEFVYNGGGVGVADFNNDGYQDVFFTGNMVDNKLYINKGDWRFEDVTDVAGVAGSNKWSSGVAVIDINNDGWQDLYVCATTYPQHERRANALYVNTGVDDNGVPAFRELGMEYGVGDTSHTIAAAFFDYDRDGDLDLFLAVNQMDHRHTPNTYREKITDGSSIRTDRLLRNDFDTARGHAVYTDVSSEAGISIEGFSLGVNIVDINTDGWEDIYVTNDYVTNDLVYVNNRDGTFTDRASEYFKHTSFSAMGNDVADLNNDGLEDIVALDMLPEDNFRRKTMLPANNYTSYINNDRFGYQYQYVRNTLQLNRGTRPGSGVPLFSEVAMFAGISSTDWSWAPLIADFDNDGDRDLIVTNGFPKDVTDHDFIDYNSDKGSFLTREQLLTKIPSVKIRNYAFRNDISAPGAMPVFSQVMDEWGITEPTFSNGGAYADFDNDGDLDYMVSNINDSASVFRNMLMESASPGAHYLRINFAGPDNNRNGYGATVAIYYGDTLQVWRNTPYRGYLSSVESGAHFGLGPVSLVDSLEVTWPGGRKQVLIGVMADHELDVAWSDAMKSTEPVRSDRQTLLQDVTDSVGIRFVHPELDYVDFNVQRLLFHKLSQYGPGIAVADINGDGLDDFYVGGSHFHKGKFFIQGSDGTFSTADLLPGEDGDSKREEELGVLFFDADNDGDSDLYLVSGGYEFPISDTVYRDRLFLNENGAFSLAEDALPDLLSSGSCVKSADFDRDGDLDLFVGGRVMPTQYPEPVSSYILRNDGTGHFTVANAEAAPDLDHAGMICDALWTDHDGDGWTDLLVAGEWMPLQVFRNNAGVLSERIAIGDSQSGWWNSLAAGDFDGDGDMDYIGGNFGTNSLIRASREMPVAIYGGDLDGNTGYDALPSAWFPDVDGQMMEYPLFGRSDMEKQIVLVKRHYLRHNAFGEAPMSEVIDKLSTEPPDVWKATYLQSSYIENLGDGKFSVRPLPDEAQLAPVFGIVVSDFNGDHFPDALLVGNDYGAEVSMGRYDALNGLLLLGDGQGEFTPVPVSESGFAVPGDGKSLTQLMGANGARLVVSGQNQGMLQVHEVLAGDQVAMPLNAMDCRAIIHLDNGRSYHEELAYGHSYLSQGARRLWVPADAVKVEIIDYKGETREIHAPGNEGSLQ